MSAKHATRSRTIPQPRHKGWPPPPYGFSQCQREPRLSNAGPQTVARLLWIMFALSMIAFLILPAGNTWAEEQARSARQAQQAGQGRCGSRFLSLSLSASTRNVMYGRDKLRQGCRSCRIWPQHLRLKSVGLASTRHEWHAGDKGINFHDGFEWDGFIRNVVYWGNVKALASRMLTLRDLPWHQRRPLWDVDTS